MDFGDPLSGQIGYDSHSDGELVSDEEPVWDEELIWDEEPVWDEELV
jgi:hypothetical protein